MATRQTGNRPLDEQWIRELETDGAGLAELIGELSQLVANLGDFTNTARAAVTRRPESAAATGKVSFDPAERVEIETLIGTGEYQHRRSCFRDLLREARTSACRCPKPVNLNGKIGPIENNAVDRS